MKRALIGLALLLVSSAPAARAGDPQAHTAAMTQAAQHVANETDFKSGLGAPQKDGVTQVGQFLIPTIGNVACPFQTDIKYDDGSCPYIGLNGQAINAPDDWGCIDARMPPALNMVNRTTAPGQAQFARALQAVGESRAAMVCNYNHFSSNPVGPAGGDSTSAAAITLSWANTIPDTIAAAGGVPDLDPQKAMQCNNATWLRYYARVANSLHYTQDSVCEDHAKGNVACSAEDAMGVFNSDFTFREYNSCQTFLSTTGYDISAGDGTTACDESVVNNASAPAALNSDMVVVYGLCQTGMQLSCMGMERTIRHHCSLPGTPKTLVCQGPPDDHQRALGKQQFCEGEVYSAAGGENFLANATAASIPVIEAAATKWASVCKEPDDPCVPAQCDLWCKRSNSKLVDENGIQTEETGHCVNASPDDHCVLHTCRCEPIDSCGLMNQACCTKGAPCSSSALECGKATGTCVPTGSETCQPFSVTVTPAAETIAEGTSQGLTAALFLANVAQSTSGAAFHWVNTGKDGALMGSSRSGNDLCISDSTVTYVPASQQTPGDVDTITVTVYPSGNCTGRAAGFATAKLTISAPSPVSVWKLKNIAASGSNPIPDGDTTDTFAGAVSNRFKSDLATWTGAAAGSPGAYLTYTIATGLSLQFKTPESDGGTLDSYPKYVATVGPPIWDQALDTASFQWSYAVDGSPPVKGTVSGQTSDNPGVVCLPRAPHPKLLLGTEYPNYKYAPIFNMNGNTGSGVLVYTYRVVEDHCRIPGDTKFLFTLTVSFDADRVE
jgi:hypothetical protein